MEKEEGCARETTQGSAAVSRRARRNEIFQRIKQVGWEREREGGIKWINESCSKDGNAMKIFKLDRAK